MGYMKMKNLVILSVIVLGLVVVLALRGQADPATNAAPSKPIPYPLKTCIVSGEELGGDMGDPIVFVYTNNGANQEIKFCCPMCKPKFLKEPDKYMKIIKAAEAAQAKQASK